MSEQTKTTTQIYAEQLKAVMADNQRLRDSLVKHFEDEHLAGDGPEIDRWRAENRRLKAEMEQTAERANREAQLACDLRTSQDEVIERCAKAVEEWPEAAARLRQHCGNSEETAVSGEDFGELRRQYQQLRSELADARRTITILRHEPGYRSLDETAMALKQALPNPRPRLRDRPLYREIPTTGLTLREKFHPLSAAQEFPDEILVGVISDPPMGCLEAKTVMIQVYGPLPPSTHMYGVFQKMGAMNEL